MSDAPTVSTLAGQLLYLFEDDRSLVDAPVSELRDRLALDDRIGRARHKYPNDNDAEILARIRAKFIAAGWIDVTGLQGVRPDVVVLTSALAQEHTGTVYDAWWGSWGYWPGWPTAYGSDWIWGVPGTEFEFTYFTGTLIITMLDVNDADATQRRIPALWLAAINGVLTSSAVDGALNGINQAFVQSPYLVRP